MKIIGLIVTGFRKVKAVRMKLDPAGNAVFVTGNNSAGKTSVIDAILAALGGGEMPEHAVQIGAERAEIRLDLGGLTVRKVIEPGKSPRLIVKTPDGLSGGQAALDAIVGAVGLDPVELAKLPAAQQAGKLCDALGLKLDFARIDGQAKTVWAEREALNRSVRDDEGALKAFDIPEGTPAAEVSISDLLTRQRAANSINAANAERRRELQAAQTRQGESLKIIAKAQEEIDRLRKSLKAAENTKAHAVEFADGIAAEVVTAEEVVAALVPADTSEIEKALEGAESTNQYVRARIARDNLAAGLTKRRAKAAELTERLSELKAEKVKITGERFPKTLAGIELDEAHGLTVGGLPLEDLGTGERLRVTTQIALALNPKLRVVLIRAGNDLDADNMKAVVDAAAQADAQVWIERIEAPAEGGDVVEIVDGEGQIGDFAAEDAAAAAEAAKPKAAPRKRKAAEDLFERDDAEGKG